MKLPTTLLVIIVVIMVGVHKGNGEESLGTDPGSTIADQRKDSSNWLDIVKAGVRRGLRVCQRLFRNKVWDCSFYNKTVTRKLPDFMATTLPYANRETGFLHAITTAAIMYEVVHQCKKDKIPRCRQFDPIEFGENMTRNVLDDLHQGNRGRQQVDFHKSKRQKIDFRNNEVGMMVLKLKLRTKCKCPSRGCDTQVCWKLLDRFHSAAAELKKKYRRAEFLPGNRHNPRRDLSLIYLDSSPDYCVRNKTVGSLGLLGRICTSKSRSKCKSLCGKCNLRPHREERTNQIKCN